MKRLVGILLLTAFCALAAQLPRKAADFAIQTAPEKYIWLSQYEGKTTIVAFILTYCSHCQKTTEVLNRIQKDYANRGVQVVASAIEDMSSLHIPDFEKKFAPQFPVGYNERGYAVKFLGMIDTEPLMMPQLVFIDRGGIIRAQLAGDDPLFQNDQDKNLRTVLDRVLKEGQTTSRLPARTAVKR